MKSRFNLSGIQLLIINSSLLIITSCSIEKQIAKSAKADVLDAKALQTAHVGISIFDPAANKYLYNYQGDKYFVPASNIKIPTCYAAMKYLGDSLVGLRYGIPENSWIKNKAIFIQATGDPTFLHQDYSKHPSFEFLQKMAKEGKKFGYLLDDSSKVERWGSGWSWNDYDAAYMAERNIFPVFGNVINIKLNEIKNRNANNKLMLFKTGVGFFDRIVNDIPFLEGITREQFETFEQNWILTRSIESNTFSIEKGLRPFSSMSIPFVTESFWTTVGFLNDTLDIDYAAPVSNIIGNKYFWEGGKEDEGIETKVNKWNIIHSQPTDSLLKPMMHRSDNFFAEQSLLMVSNEMLGVMNDAKIIDTILKTDFKDLPQKPRWADGSGLSRYNLFTPQDFVFILNKMKTDFGMERIKIILPTGGEGTISSYYKADSGYIYGKTGTLSGVVAFSGFLYTKKGKLLIFSTLVNNHQASATEVRKAVEKFLQGVREKF